ncbi:MAG TPA: cyclopropane-fatty-acyl-phospholipid synthase family protein [Lacunisphaera sp.]|nr:cyclopropane-fatty-acyl-phospholipid synthase family protein [Lacunisphaera sp.]
MNLETTLSRPATAPAAPDFHQRLVLSAFARMTRGHFTLVLPDGTQRTFGDPAGRAWPATAAAPAARALRGAAVVHVHRARFFRRCVLQGDIGFAEAHLDGDWTSPDLAAVIAWFLLNLEDAPTLSGSRAGQAGLNLLRWLDRLVHLARPNSRRTAARNIREHYDLSNEFFALWLDPTMMYSAALWRDGTATLEAAQHAKNEALCRKLRLRPEDHVLEIGTGWGGWALHAARHHGCRVTSLTLSPRQHALARERIAAAGLADRIEVRLQDYRDLPAAGRYDKLVSIEMLEAVGHRYLEDWCRVAARALRPDGLMALQFITCPDARYASFRRGVDFIQKHIFPGSLLLSANRLNDLLSRTGGFVLHTLDDLGQDYALTLRAWREAFTRREDEVRALGFDERFLRKWHYYLAYCEAAFALRNISVVQTVHTRPNNVAF